VSWQQSGPQRVLPTSPLSCTWRTPWRQRPHVVPDKTPQELRRQLVPGKDAQEQRPRFVPETEQQERLTALYKRKFNPVHLTTRTCSFQSRGESTPNPVTLFLSHSLYRATPKAMRGVFFLSFLALSFPHSNHRATRYVIREFVCTPSLSLSLSRTLFRATSIAMRGVGDFPHIETPFPPVPYALRALAAIETSTGSGLRPRRPTLSLSCTCRTPSRQRR
jgi:hypothetical protein